MRSTGIVRTTGICSAILFAVFAVYGQKNNATKDNFLLDDSKPYVYLEVDHIGSRPHSNTNEPDTGIYLRLRNNCRVPIVISTFGGPSGSTDGEIGVMDRVELNPTDDDVIMFHVPPYQKPSEPLLDVPDAILSPAGIDAKTKLARQTQENQKKEAAQEKARIGAQEKEIKDRPRGYQWDVSSATILAPGTAVYFSLPINHVNKAWHFEIDFRFDVKRRGPIRQPQSYVSFYWDDVPQAYRAAYERP